MEIFSKQTRKTKGFIWLKCVYYTLPTYKRTHWDVASFSLVTLTKCLTLWPHQEEAKNWILVLPGLEQVGQPPPSFFGHLCKQSQARELELEAMALSKGLKEVRGGWGVGGGDGKRYQEERPGHACFTESPSPWVPNTMGSPQVPEALFPVQIFRSLNHSTTVLWKVGYLFRTQ